VLQRDTARRFRFTPIQSPYGRRLAEALGIDPENPDTNAVILDGRALRRLDAALAVLSSLPNWHWVNFLRLAPRAVRDAIYGLVARNRYRVFGRREACDLADVPSADRIIVDAPAAR